jgi:hypothetical protein
MKIALRVTVAALAFFVSAAFAQEGALGSDPQLLAWSEALKQWKKEGESAAFELSRGILFDCVAHRPSRDVSFDPGKSELAGNPACRAGRQMPCAQEAERAFARAVKLDPGLTEARLRLATAKSERGSREGGSDLATLYASQQAPREQRYLAAVFLGKSAWAAKDQPGATAWFTRAAALEPSWTVAPLLRAATAPAATLEAAQWRSRDDSSMDPFYAYRCGVFTAVVRENLAARIRRAAGQ